MNGQAERPVSWEAIIVGAGPAGLNAALVLGRCRRKVLVLDDAQPRNAVSHALHGLLSRDGIDPAELLAIARAQLRPYGTVHCQAEHVVDALRTPHGFEVATASGLRFQSRKLLLCGGVEDHLPAQPGFRELYGKGVFHCPYCDGWEMRDQALAVYGRGDSRGAGLALAMTLWSGDVILCTDGPAELSDACRQQLERNGVGVREDRIVRLDVECALPYRASFHIVFESGPRLHRAGIFFNTGRHQSTDLAARLGCEHYDAGGCRVDDLHQATSVPGLYVAGDASRDVLQVVVAAAEGAQAAIGINTALLREDLRA